MTKIKIYIDIKYNIIIIILGQYIVDIYRKLFIGKFLAMT